MVKIQERDNKDIKTFKPINHHVNNLAYYEQNFKSQNGEDGVLHYLLSFIEPSLEGLRSKSCINLSHDGSHNPCIVLESQSYHVHHFTVF